MTTECAQKRLAAALSVRVGPTTGTSFKVLAHAIGRSEGSIIAYARAERAASVDTVDAMARFFARRGDPNFLPEVFGADVAGPADICLWATDDGALSPAPRGPAEFVRSTLALGGDTAFDAVAYAVRVLGWIGITLQPSGDVVIRRHMPHASPDAAARVAAWLTDQGRAFASITMHSLQGDVWSTRRYDTISGAVAAITGTPTPSVAEQISTSIAADRLRLEDIADPAQAKLLRAWDGSQTGLDDMLRALDPDAAGRASILRADDDGFTVMSAGAGTHLRRDLSGRPLRIMRDQRYVDVVETHLDAALADGAPRLDDLRITAAGDAGAYRRLALPVTGGDGLSYCLTLSEIYAPPQHAVIQ